MKLLLLIPSAILFSTGCKSNNLSQFSRNNVDLNIVDSIYVSSDKAKECNQIRCLESMKKEAKSFDKSIVIFKNDSNKWIIEKDKKKQIAAINSYKGSHIRIWEGHIKIAGVKITNEEQVVSLW